MPKELPQELSVWILSFLEKHPDSAFSPTDIQRTIARQDYVTPSVPEIDTAMRKLYSEGEISRPHGPSTYMGATLYKVRFSGTLVLVEDIANTLPLEGEAKRLGGGMTGTLSEERSAMFVLPDRGTAADFIYYCWQQGYKAGIQQALFSGIFSPLEALREDAERIRRALKKPGARPPWAR